MVAEAVSEERTAAGDEQQVVVVVVVVVVVNFAGGRVADELPRRSPRLFVSCAFTARSRRRKSRSRNWSCRKRRSTEAGQQSQSSSGGGCILLRGSECAVSVRSRPRNVRPPGLPAVDSCVVATAIPVHCPPPSLPEKKERTK